MIDDRTRAAYHESGHGCAALVLRRSVQYLSIRPGRHFGGLTQLTASKLSHRTRDYLHLPAILWPAHLRRSLEVRAVVSLAGPAAELAIPHSGYRATQPCEEAAAEATSTLAGLAPRLRKQVIELEESDEPIPDDEDAAREDLRVLSGEQAAAHYAYLNAVAKHLVAVHWPQVEAVAGVLLEREVLSGHQVQEITEQVKQGEFRESGTHE